MTPGSYFGFGMREACSLMGAVLLRQVFSLTVVGINSVSKIQIVLKNVKL